MGFWKTLPGIMTGVAAVVAAIAGLITVLVQLGGDSAGGGGIVVQRLWVEPQQVDENVQPIIMAELVNMGQSEDEISLQLTIDGQVFESRKKSLGPAQRETQVFTAPTLPAGVHTVRILDSEARYVVGKDDECTLRTGVEARLQNVVDEITPDQDGHIELSFRNPGVNGCNIDADLRITFPTEIVAYGKEGITSGTAGTLNSLITEIPPGGERVIIADFKCRKPDNYFIIFKGNYWPTKNEELFQPITLQRELSCTGAPAVLARTPDIAATIVASLSAVPLATVLPATVTPTPTSAPTSASTPMPTLEVLRTIPPTQVLPTPTTTFAVTTPPRAATPETELDRVETTHNTPSSDTNVSPVLPESPANGMLINTYIEDFDENSLRPDWKITSEDPTRWDLQPERSSLLIVTQKGSIWGGATGLKNQFILDKRLPEGDFEIIVKASIEIRDAENSMSVALFQDENNYLEIGYWGRSGSSPVYRAIHFTKEIEGKRISIDAGTIFRGAAKAPDLFLLKIEREGNFYTGYYSFPDEDVRLSSIDEVAWIKIATQTLTEFEGQLSFWADNRGSATIAEVATEFHFVIVRPSTGP